MLAKKSIRYNNGMKLGETSQVRTMCRMDVRAKRSESSVWEISEAR